MKTSPRNPRRVWVNPNQRKLLEAKQLTVGCTAGRGGGKTTNIGDQLVQFHRGMPGSKGFLLNKTFGQAYTKTLPEILGRMEQYGYKEHLSRQENGHYVVTKTPPEWYGKPHKKARRFDNTITFVNHMMVDLLSFDRPDLGRGGSYDFGIVDEAALIDYEQFKKTIRPLLRGNVKAWNHPMRFKLLCYTSRSWTNKGKWVEETLKQLAAEDPENYFYIEFSARDNLPVLGEQYFERMKAELDPITYAVEILNNPITKIPDGYYSNLDEDVHTYSSRYDYDYDDGPGIWKVKGEKDVNPTRELEVSFDFNAAFTSATMWQEFLPGKNDGATSLDKSVWELRCIRNFFVKYQQINDLIDKVCDHYANHPIKTINVYGGKDGHNKQSVVSEYTIYQLIKNRFTYHGWECYIQVELQYADIEHKLKHLGMNAILRENDPSLPVIRIHEEAAKETFISMSQTPVKGDFKKDKSSESDENLAQEYATHLSDTVDNYAFPKSKRQIKAAGTSSLAAAWAGA